MLSAHRVRLSRPRWGIQSQQDRQTGIGNIADECWGDYLKKCQEGKIHNYALRCLARQMLTLDRDYEIRKEDVKIA